jgi:hypothetical protein
MVGDVDQPERLDVGLAEDGALAAELEEHVDGRQYALNLGQDGGSVFFAADRQMLGMGLAALCRRRLQSEGRHHLALDPAPDFRGSGANLFRTQRDANHDLASLGGASVASFGDGDVDRDQSGCVAGASRRVQAPAVSRARVESSGRRILHICV